MAKKNGSIKAVNSSDQEKANLSQGEFPRYSLEKSLPIARALYDEFGGRSATPHDVAIAINMAPTSGTWRNLCGASVAYGLTDGGYNAKEITLTPLGRDIVAGNENQNGYQARTSAVLKPRIMRAFFEKYERAKFPSDHVAESVLRGLGLPSHRISGAVDILRENGRFSRVLKNTKTGLFVAIDSGTVSSAQVDPVTTEFEGNEPEEIPTEVSRGPSVVGVAAVDRKNNRVFVGHGKNVALLSQIKDLLSFGRFEPVIAVENETTAVSVPEKVFDDMRSCSAGLIHICDEEKLLDQNGQERIVLNPNVLIEVGAARALYRDRIILLVKKGIQLPSNLQGLYKCEYEGDSITHETTMKLLKAFTKLQELLNGTLEKAKPVGTFARSDAHSLSN